MWAWLLIRIRMWNQIWIQMQPVCWSRQANWAQWQYIAFAVLVATIFYCFVEVTVFEEEVFCGHLQLLSLFHVHLFWHQSSSYRWCFQAFYIKPDKGPSLIEVSQQGKNILQNNSAWFMLLLYWEELYWRVKWTLREFFWGGNFKVCLPEFSFGGVINADPVWCQAQVLSAVASVPPLSPISDSCKTPPKLPLIDCKGIHTYMWDIHCM